MKPRKMSKPRKMQVPGHYRRKMVKTPGRMNAPRVGRVGKLVPPMKKLRPKVRRGR